MYVEAHPAPVIPVELTRGQMQSLIDNLENQVEQLDDRLRKLEGRPSRAEESDESYAALVSKQADRELDSMAMLRHHNEQQEHYRKEYLVRCKIPEDADKGLIRFALATRDLEDRDRRNLLSLVVATAGHDCEGAPKWPDVLDAWPKLSELVRTSLVNDAETRAVEARRVA